MSQPKRFLALFDMHWGYERRSGHKVALHDTHAINVALAFAKDFHPDAVILGGDILDCASIGHHDRQKPGKQEGMRLASDAEECVTHVIEPLKALKAKEYHFITGNHCAWLEDLTDELPGLGGLLDVRNLLQMPKSWSVYEQGGHVNLGKLTFIHGDQLSGGEHVTKAAAISWERNLRFGHHHSYSAYTKNTPIHDKLGKTAVSVPCLCTKGPKYGEARANKWLQGFNWGYVFPDGTFTDYVSIITNGRTVANGKVYTS